MSRLEIRAHIQPDSVHVISNHIVFARPSLKLVDSAKPEIIKHTISPDTAPVAEGGSEGIADFRI